MYVLHNIVARSRNHCCRGKAKMHSAFVVELRVTVSYIKIWYYTTKILRRIYAAGNNKTFVNRRMLN